MTSKPARKQPPPEEKAGEWTIHVHAVDCAEGVKSHLSAGKEVSVTLLDGSKATIACFMRALNAIDEHPFNTATIMDLTPYDESKLGKDTKNYGRDYDEDEDANWVPAVSNPRPVNCTWTPSKKNPQQTVSKAGLCDGADLAIVKVSYWKG